MMRGGGASPYDLPDCVAVDVLASLARRVGASAVLLVLSMLTACADLIAHTCLSEMIDTCGYPRAGSLYFSHQPAVHQCVNF